MTLRIRTFIKCAVVLCARGEQQLLAFARAVQSDGRVLCLEESSSALGVTIEARVNKIVYATAVTAVVAAGERWRRPRAARRGAPAWTPALAATGTAQAQAQWRAGVQRVAG